MLVEEIAVNATENLALSEPIAFEPFTENVADLFRAMQKEHGQCVSKVYVDTEQGTKAVGWVFEKTARYEDTKEPFTLRVWVTLLAAPDAHTVTKHYHYID